MRKPVILLASFLMVAAEAVHAQQTAPVPEPPPPAAATPVPDAPPPATAPTAGPLVLREGSDVALKFDQDITSKTAAEGDPVVFILDDDIKVGGVVVVKSGAKAFGEVTRASKSGMMGKAGDLAIRLDYLKVGDTKVKLRGVKGKEGESGVTGTVVLTVLFGPIGLIKHGKNVEIKQGTSLPAFVADDITLPPAA